jgi:hypothetical protein
MGERLKTLGYYIPRRVKGEYSDRDIYETLSKAIRDFEKEKYLLVKPPYSRITYYCPRCLWFTIDIDREIDIDSECGYCLYRLRYADKRFIIRITKLLRKYITRVKPVLSELREIFTYFKDYVIDNYSEIYIEIDNPSIGLADIWIYPHLFNRKFTMYLHIVFYELNPSRLDVVDRLERLIEEYGLNAYIWIMNSLERLEKLIALQYGESIAFNSYNYAKLVFSKYIF